MKLTYFLDASKPNVYSDCCFDIKKIKSYNNGNLILDKLHNYYLGVFNALVTFEGTIDSDMNNIDENDFNYECDIDRVTKLKAYLTVPKNMARVRAKDIDITIEITDKLKEVASVLAEIADYSFSCKDIGFSDNTKDFENINEFAIDGLKILGEYKE